MPWRCRPPSTRRASPVPPGCRCAWTGRCRSPPEAAPGAGKPGRPRPPIAPGSPGGWTVAGPLRYTAHLRTRSPASSRRLRPRGTWAMPDWDVIAKQRLTEDWGTLRAAYLPLNQAMRRTVEFLEKDAGTFAEVVVVVRERLEGS